MVFAASIHRSTADQVQAKNKGLALAFEVEYVVILGINHKRLLCCELKYPSNAIRYYEPGETRIRDRPWDNHVKTSVPITGEGIAQRGFPMLFE